MSETGSSEGIVVPDDQQEAVAQALRAAGEKNDGIGPAGSEVMQTAKDSDPGITDDQSAAEQAAQNVLQTIGGVLTKLGS
jgi:hypothetical protein